MSQYGKYDLMISDIQIAIYALVPGRAPVGLQANWNVELDGEIASHVIDTHTASRGIDVGIFDTAQVVLVSLVKQVIGDDSDVGDNPSPVFHLCAYRGTEQGIGWSGGLTVAFHQVVVLPCIAVDVDGDEGVGERVTVTNDVVTQFAFPAHGRCAGQVTALERLIQQARVNKADGVLEVQRFNRMDVHTGLSAPQAGVAARVLIGSKSLGLYARQPLDVDIVTDVIKE